jgi:hypothetical protein
MPPPDRGGRSWLSMRPLASCSGCTARMKARGRKWQRSDDSFRAAAWLTGATAPSLASSLRDHRIPADLPGRENGAFPIPVSARTGLSTSSRTTIRDRSGKGREIGLHATPIVAKDVVIVAPAFSGVRAQEQTNVERLVRAFDVRTGKRIWTFTPSPSRANSATTPGTAPGRLHRQHRRVGADFGG